MPAHNRNRLRQPLIGHTTPTSETVPPSNEDWRSRARCKGEPMEIFFAADNERGARLRRQEWRAKRICHACPVLEYCRDYALDAREPYGIWGAMTSTERRHLLARSGGRL
jgi:WhiB family transcriptional regulator, redox-sensing transcriptional regulator